MIDSLRLLLEDFLGLMREEGELDVFLPLLMSAMGHEVLYRPQRGARQYGVDIVSVGADSEGERTLFLWLVKRGDIVRTEWDSGPQSVRQSINDVGTVYLRSHVAPEHQGLRKKLFIVTNGDFVSALHETIASFLDEWSREKNVATEQVNGSKLAHWTEQYLLSEYILPGPNRALLRRMLANVSSPDLCVVVGRRLLDEMLQSTLTSGGSAGSRAKGLLTGLRGVRTALSVLLTWARSEDNLLAAYILSQYSVLAVWARLHERLRMGEAPLRTEFTAILLHLAGVAEEYHQRMDAYYRVQDGFANAVQDSLLVSRAVFDELGRLGQQGCFLAFQASAQNAGAWEVLMHRNVSRVLTLIRSHSCSGLPAYDHHSVNVHAAMLLLVVTGHHSPARDWIEALCARLNLATRARKYLPMEAPFEDAILMRHGFGEISEEFTSTSTLLPILLIWTAVLGMDDFYRFLREHVLPALEGTTPNVWSTDVGYDDTVADPAAIRDHGIGEAFLQFPEDPDEFLRQMSSDLDGVDSFENADWYQARAPYVPLLAALHWQVQMPRQALVRQAMAFAQVASPSSHASVLEPPS